MKIYYRHIITLLILLLVCMDSVELVSQGDQTIADKTEIKNDSKREEVQRYFGYELLLYRYLSLPYDVSINVNQTGNWVDVGFLYILFIPLLILLFLRSRKSLYFLSVLYLFFTWIISTSNSFIFSFKLGKISSTKFGIDNYLNAISFSDEPFTHIVAYLYKFSLWLYEPLKSVGNSLSGDSDYITYPIIFTGFVLFSIVIARAISGMAISQRVFICLLWAYGFYWFAFSGGIVWYGYILLLGGLFLIAILIEELKKVLPGDARIMNLAFISLGCLWIFFNLGLRTSDIQPMMDRKYFAKGLFNPVYYDYAAGKLDYEKSLEIIYADVNKAFNRINEDDKSLIWRFGTSFSYFINNNHKRIIEDNQLGLFFQLHQKYPEKLGLIDVMKASGIKYLMIDLNTASIDNTPDKSLTSKFTQLLTFAINNPYLKLLATDRIVGKTDANGQRIYVRDIYGEEIHQFGRYAIYEIM